MNLYEILDVHEGATPDELHKAYRARAAECHPDLHPELEEAFKELSRAYAILSVPERRRRYDETGKEDTLTPEQSIKQQAFELIGTMFMSVIDSEGDGIFGADVVKLISDRVIGAKQQYQSQIELADKGLVQWKKIKARISYNGKSVNQMEYVCEQQTADLQQQMAYAIEGIKVSDKIVELLEDYQWDHCTSMISTQDFDRFAERGRQGMWTDRP